MKRKIIGILICMLLILTIIPVSVTSTETFEKTIMVDDKKLADNVDINPLRLPIWLTIIPDVPAFEIELRNNNDVKIYEYDNINIRWNDGTLLYFQDTHNINPFKPFPMNPGVLMTISLCWDIYDFILKGYSIGSFTVEVSIEIFDENKENPSYKTSAFNGFFFFGFVFI